MRVVLVDPEGREHSLEGEPGQSVMALAVAHGVPGIEAECGGACACATCHVYVEPERFRLVGPPPPLEADMLEFANAERQPTSRLSCQIKLHPSLEGLHLTVAGGG
ncbi:2Fe-2S iron-sulfur cluster-binding protein [uncultured Phenylobacterium sp.]|uniref:2Fe-2S iron-sulfur cluster-binding protein n=1 Tax=uncultured Phenylobacterium sp. TaxID=349273 RepID=UPI00345D8237